MDAQFWHRERHYRSDRRATAHVFGQRVGS